MTNSEAIKIIGSYAVKNAIVPDCHFPAFEIAINCIKENDKLKAEIERLIELMPKICETCKYEYELGYEEPCNSCENYKKWVLKGKVGE